ncbi:MAG: hypothetical protein WC824_04880 [Bacteroidota bacterium]|jgi:hypothetical protein
MMRSLFLIVGIVSIIVLGIVIFLPGNNGIDSSGISEQPPGQQLEMFLVDKMDYGLRFSRILAERRIAMARRFAAKDPSLESRAREVIDSLTARLDRKAKM